MSELFNYCHVVGKSDIGRRRKANEDNMANAITQNGLVSVVCDGMGGHVGGATASRIAVNTIIEHLQSVYYEDPRIAIGEAIDRANQAILQQAALQPELQGMGSTCVLLIVRGGKVYFGHVGDSRIYLVQSRRIKQLTKDHSYVQMLVDAGQITMEQAEHHPRKNEITNALGIPNMQPATVAEDAILPEAGDCFVLCSDGLSGMVPDATICKVVSRQAEMNAQDRVNQLVQLANDNGGVDNITVQMVEFSVSPAAAAKVENGKTIPQWLKIGAPVAVLLILIGVGLFFYLRKPAVPQADGVGDAVASTVVKGDTIELTLGPLPYKKGAKLVELVYAEESITLQGEKSPLYTDNVKLDPTTLKVENPAIEVKYNNSLLLFTDKDPGKEVSFTLTSATDTTKVHRYRITIGSGNLNFFKPADPNAPATPQENKKKVEQMDLSFEFTTLEKGAQLEFDITGNPTLSFDKAKKSLGREVVKIDFQKVGLAKGWIKESGKDKQLLIKLEKPNDAEKYEFLLPCEDKEGKPFNIHVILQKKAAVPAEETKPAAPEEEKPVEEKPQENVKPDGDLIREA
ncbi:MAG: Stp1/IreP family PP2C-type Ser/Thr phosphatase [Bacteroides sp.]